MCIGRNNMNRISRSNPGMLKIKHKEALKESDIKEIKRWIEKN